MNILIEVPRLVLKSVFDAIRWILEPYFEEGKFTSQSFCVICLFSLMILFVEMSVSLISNVYQHHKFVLGIDPSIAFWVAIVGGLLFARIIQVIIVIASFIYAFVYPEKKKNEVVKLKNLDLESQFEVIEEEALSDNNSQSLELNG